MHQLAFIAVVNSSGGKLKLPAADIAAVEEKTGGCRLLMRDGRSYELKTTADDVLTAIDALWAAYLTALGDPT